MPRYCITSLTNAVVFPLAGPAELAAFFGPVRSLVVPGRLLWQHAELQMGRLVQREVPLLQAA